MHRYFLSLICLIILPLTAAAKTLQMVTDDYPPYSYKKNGSISGICMDVIQNVFGEHDYDFNVLLYPFARAYVTARDGENIFQFCVARTPEREELFQWIGPVGPSYEGLVALRKRADISIDADSDMSAHTIGTVIEDVVDQHLSLIQEELGLMLDKASGYRQNIRKLMAGRIDIWAGNIFVAFQLAEELGYDPEDLRVVYTFPDLHKDFYLVTGLKSDPDLVKDLTRIFDSYVEKGGYEEMKKRFIKSRAFGFSEQ